MSGRLFQLSGVVIDLVYTMKSLPAAGDEVESTSFETAVGGGFNAAAAARRLGVDVVYAGALGTGTFADLAAAALAAEGISLADDARVPLEQGHCIALVDEQAERTFISHHGAERHVAPTQLEKLRVTEADWLLLSGYSLFKKSSANVFLPWLEKLPAGPSFLFDPGPVVDRIDRKALEVALKRANWLSVNAREASVLTGTSDAEEAAGALSAGRAGAIVRIGADGCWLAASEHVPLHIAGFEVPVCDSNGAGDTHDGSFIAGAILGLDPRRAALFANATAALSTTKHGPATAPDLRAVQTFLVENGMRLFDHASAEQIASTAGAG